MNKSPAAATFALIREKEFSRFLLTRFLVIFSLFAQTTVLSYLMYSLTHDPLSLGIIGLAELIPAFSLALLAGYWVDKLEKRTVYLICILMYILNTLFIIWITSKSFIQTQGVSRTEYMIYAGMFISGCIRSFLAPASFSLLPLLIPRERIPQAITWSSSAWLSGSVLGPLAGGALMATIGITNTLCMSGCALMVSALCIIQVKKKPFTPSVTGSMLQGMGQGFKFIFSSQLILAVLSLDLFAVLFGGAESMLPVFAKEILHMDEVAYGWLRSAHGIGSIVLMLILAWLPLKTRVGQKLLWSVFGFGVCIILFGWSANVYLSFACLFLAGMFDGVSVVIRHSILQLKTPEEMKGRVSSVNMMFISSSNELGAFESGVAARLLGTVPSVIFGGLMTILVVIITRFSAPALHRVRLEDDKKQKTIN
ncbi:MAG TPA: MFS transporter [Chitinophagaceae bacterium]|nr:MFS transporter [Chitinophagaceae bacterium]HNF71950.1 MFS transporter [Chitinophagaceae bacterium]